jgi:hypothetical protein
MGDQIEERTTRERIEFCIWWAEQLQESLLTIVIAALSSLNRKPKLFSIRSEKNWLVKIMGFLRFYTNYDLSCLLRPASGATHCTPSAYKQQPGNEGAKRPDDSAFVHKTSMRFACTSWLATGSVQLYLWMDSTSCIARKQSRRPSARRQDFCLSSVSPLGWTWRRYLSGCFHVVALESFV